VLLALATDVTYLPWCAAAALSCLRSTAARPIEVVVLHGGDVPDADQQRFVGMVEGAGGTGRFLAIADGTVAHLPSKGPALGGRTSWLRVALPALLPDHDRALYLDGDVMAVAPLDELWATPLHAAPIGAVPNVVGAAMRAHVEGLGLDPDGGYFNAGVLLLDLERMRREGTAVAVADFVRDRGATPWYDQDALNVVAAGRWARLDPRWNAQNSFWFWPDQAAATVGARALGEATADPGILHFEGPAYMKPWHLGCPHPFAARYREVLAATPWGAEAIDGRTPLARAIGLLPPALRIRAYGAMERRQLRRAPAAVR
jgi:lipopolysaccharide biosynthesis glycosyltransferase